MCYDYDNNKWWQFNFGKSFDDWDDICKIVPGKFNWKHGKICPFWPIVKKLSDFSLFNW